VRQADVAGKRVLVRSDLNVPLEDGRVADDTRIRASLPTLQLLLERDAGEVRVCSHLGRPKGPDPRYSMEPVRARLRELLPDERIEVLENTRFDARETKDDPDYARELADGSELYVDDAFGSAHRAHASTHAVAKILPAYAVRTRSRRSCRRTPDCSSNRSSRCSAASSATSRSRSC
jgi:phosphoglycerate kinase